MAFRIIICSYLLFFLSTSLSSSLNPPLCNSHDSLALLQFINSFSLDHSASIIQCDEFSDDYYTFQFKNSSYPKTASWVNDSNCCLWDGITCDSMSGHVISLDLSCSWLQGQLHPNSTIFQLSQLQILNLAFNDFRGSLIPSRFGELSSLIHLNLSGSSFAGEIPAKIAGLSKLVSLDLSANEFSVDGTLSLRLEPSTWEKFILNMTDLRELSLDYVNMSSIAPSSLSLLMNLSSSLFSLRLSNTDLQGNIASDILCLENLGQLDLSDNPILNVQFPKSNWSSPLSFLNLGLTGSLEELPDSIGRLTYLNHLDLSYCHFEGRVPLGLRNLTQLTYLELSENKFSGEISFLSNLKHLTHLDLAGNNFFGEIYSEISQLSELVTLDLSSNFDMKGSPSLRLAPPTWEKLIPNTTYLRVLMLSYVNMSSVTPNSLSLLMNLSSSLVHLTLRETSLQGDITNSLSYLENLRFLDLRRNTNIKIQFSKLNWSSIIGLSLSGTPFSREVPDSIGHLKSLENLFLSDCQFEGPIPPKFKNLTQLFDLDLSSNRINGGLSVLSSLANLTYLSLSNNSFRGQVPYQLSNLVNLKQLYLSYCQFEGPIPPSFKNLTQLTHLDLSSNKFSGCLSFLSTLVNIISLNISNNSFFGQVPSSLSDCEHLYTVDLSINNLSGEVPDMCGNLSELGSLLLNNNNFSGQVPSSLSNCEHLSILDLSVNHFSGELPDVFGKLGGLDYLQLHNNNFTGQVPSSLSNTSIIFLDLSFNKLQGNLPIPFIGAKFFSVSNNKFSGEISFLFCNANSLEILNLSHNILSGHIPQCLVGLTHLSVLDLQMNGFSGTLPNNYSKSNVLQTLHFNDNQLQGMLPLSLCRCNQLEIFDVGHNDINDTFPSWLDDLSELQVLVLRENKFYGAISSSNTKHPFRKLRIFDISNNHFGGSLPTLYIKAFEGMMKVEKVEVGSQYMGSKNYSSYMDSVMITWKGFTIELERILTIFTTIDLSNNTFDGEIPEAIGELHALIGLNISHNRITGSIPKSIANLTSLEWLDLSCNKLMGEIPLAMTNLNFLALLNLSQNQLEGMIPKGNQFGTFQIDSYEGNLGLCGAPLAKTCNKDEGGSPTSSSMFDFDERFGFGWKPVALGYGCGMVFGIFMGYIVFSIGKPQWLVRIFGGQSKKHAKRIRNRACRN